MLRNWVCVVLLCATACGPSPASLATTPPPPTTRPAPTLAEVLAADPRFERFVAAARATGWWEKLADRAQHWTVLAPTDSAMAALSPAQTERLREPAVLEAVVRQHLAAGPWAAVDLARQEALTTVLGERLPISEDEAGQLYLGVQPLSGGQPAANGVWYHLDVVLWPLTHQTLAEAVQADPRLSALHRALTRANLTTLAAEAGPYTLFAPTNAAFAALSAQEQAWLAKPRVLEQVLRYHFVRGVVTSAEAANLDWSTSLLDQPLVCLVSGDLWTVNDAQVVDRDLSVANGMLHLVNEVLFPPIDLGP